MIVRVLLLALSLLALGGCAKDIVTLEPVANHTLHTTAGADVDVVWVSNYDTGSRRSTLYRCHQTESGPQCQAASVTQ